jgi:hypothetical protein
LTTPSLAMNVSTRLRLQAALDVGERIGKEREQITLSIVSPSCRATIWLRSRIAARNDAPRDSHVASFIWLPVGGEGGRARRWQGFRSARPPSRAPRRLSVAWQSVGSAAPCWRGQIATRPPVHFARPSAGAEAFEAVCRGNRRDTRPADVTEVHCRFAMVRLRTNFASRRSP